MIPIGGHTCPQGGKKLKNKRNNQQRWQWYNAIVQVEKVTHCGWINRSNKEDQNDKNN